MRNIKKRLVLVIIFLNLIMVSFTSFALKIDKRIQDDITAFEIGAIIIDDWVYDLENDLYAKDEGLITDSYSTSSIDYPFVSPKRLMFGTVYVGSIIEANFKIEGANEIISIDKPNWVTVTRIEKEYRDGGLIRISFYLLVDTSSLGGFSDNLTVETDKGDVALHISIDIRNSPFPRSNLLFCKTPFYRHSWFNGSVINELFASNYINVSYTEELPKNLDNYDTILANEYILLYKSTTERNRAIVRLKEFLSSGKKLIIFGSNEFSFYLVSKINLITNDYGLNITSEKLDDYAFFYRENITSDIITDGVDSVFIKFGTPIENTSKIGKILIGNSDNKGPLAVSRKNNSSLIVVGLYNLPSFLIRTTPKGHFDNKRLFINMITGNCSDGVRNGNEIGIDYGGSCSFERGKSLMKDLLISPKNITFSKVGNKINVSALFYRDGVKGPIKVMFIQVYNSEKVEAKTVTVNDDIASVLLDLGRDHKVIVLVDPTNEIRESSKSNNRAEKEYDALPNIYIDIATIEKIKPEIMDYIKNNVKYSYVTEDKSAADIFVHVGRFNSKVVAENQYTLDKLGWGWKGGIVTRLTKNEGKPYGGLVGSFTKDGKKYIFIYGNSIDGEIAAVKSFIFYESELVNTKYSYLINQYNVNALAVYDYLHTSENKECYNENSDEFAAVVHKALNGMYTISDITIVANVSGGNVDLRLRHIKPDNSELFLSYKDPSGLPVVMAGGLWSDITAWDELGRELANEGRDVWLIEITGGSGMDCDDCPNYLYSDLTDSVLPAYINYIKSYTGKSKVQYVGHSNGARVALDALTEGKVNPDDVDTLVLVGVPGAFSELSYFASIVNKSGEVAIQRMGNKSLYHITFGRVAHELDSGAGEALSLVWFVMGKDNKISLNLFDKYFNWIYLYNDPQPGTGLNINHFSLIYGKKGLFSKTDDTIVPVEDELLIFNNIESDNKVIKDINTMHSGMLENKEVQSYIKSSLNKKIY